METLTRKRSVHQAQADFLRSEALYRGFVGGRGAGKSWVGAYDLIRRARRGRTYLVGSPTGVLLHDTTYPTLKALAQEMGVWGPVRVEQLPEWTLNPSGEAQVKLTPYPTVCLTTGATIRFRSLEDPEKARGPNLSGCWLDEASLMQEAAFTVPIACLREAGEQGWMTCTFTPRGFTHWTYQVFGSGRPDAQMVRADTRENPFNPPGFRDTLARQYAPALQRQELGGEFVSLEGAEWPAECFDHGAFWFDDWPAGANWACRTIGVDPSKGKDAKDGDYSAIVKFAVTWDGNEYCEADLARRPVDEICHAAAQAVKDFAPDGLYLEPVGFQDLMAPMIERAMRNADAHCSIHLEPDTAPKQVRIRRLTECIMGKKIAFRRTPGTQLLVQQLRDFGPRQGAAHDDGCFVAGTLIKTLTGDRPIETVREGDWVLTRSGFSRVLLAGCTGVRPVVEVRADGRGLIGTENHPVFDGMAFNPMRSVRTMWSCENITPPGPKLSSLAVSPSAATLPRSSGRTGCTSRHTPPTATPASAPCIRRCGRPLTGRFLTDTRSTTATATRSITSLATSSASPRPSTTPATAPGGASGPGGSAWGRPAPPPPSGTAPTLGVRGTSNRGSNPGKGVSLPGCPALTAGASTLPLFLTGPGSARPAVASAPTPPTVAMRGACVTGRRPAGAQPVFNLTVEAGEYFANGFLVHNCDALEMARRLAIRLLRKGKKS